MKNVLIILSIALILGSCARPIAEFNIEKDTDRVPATLTLTDLAEGDHSYWLIDDKIYEDSILEMKILESGKHNITLVSKKKKKKVMKSKDVYLNPPEKCLVNISTPEGDMVVELFEDTPLHRDNFVKLAEEGFYDGTIFHRVIDGFMIQGGDPNSKEAQQGERLGTGGPGYQIDAEIKPEKFVHKKGALSAARMGDQVNPEKKSSGSQFYIVHGKPLTDQELKRYEISKGITYPTHVKEEYVKLGGVPFLDGEYTVFGQVIEGLEIIERIAQKEKDRADRPLEDLPMEVKIIK